MTIAFNVFVQLIGQEKSRSHEEEELEMLVKQFERVLHLECSLVKVMEEWTEFCAKICHQKKN